MFRVYGLKCLELKAQGLRLKVGSSMADLIEGPLLVALDKLAPWKEEPGREPESLKKTCS